MRISVYLALTGGILLCLLARQVSSLLRPPLAAVTLVVSALLAAFAWVWNLALLVAPLPGRLNYVAALGHWSGAALAAHDPVPAAIAVVAALLVAGAATGLVISGYRISMEVCRVSRAVRRCEGGSAGGVVVVEDDAVRAVAVPGLRGRVLITTGMIHELAAGERRVVLAHERAHLRHVHVLYRLTVRLAAAVFPLVRPLVTECDYQLERWADEKAASVVGDRQVVARALAKAALATRQSRAIFPGPVMAFSERGVAGRVAALLAAPPAGRVLPLAIPSGLVLAVLAATVEASRDLQALFEVAERLAVR